MAEIITTTDTQTDWQTGILDNVVASPEGNLELLDSTVTGAVEVQYTADFESDFDSWYNDNSFSGWRRQSGGTSSISTGPSSAQSGSFYVYVETTNGDSFDAGNEDILRYDSPDNTITNISFYRNRYGSDQGTLYLEGWTGVAWEVIASWSGNEGDSWILSEHPCNHSSVRFRNVAAGGYMGDVALDNIVVTTGGTIPAMGIRESPPVDLSTLGVSGRHNKVEWSATPNGESIQVFIALSGDSGATWGDWVSVENGGSITSLAFQDLSTTHIKIRQDLSTITTGVTPQIHSMVLTVYNVLYDPLVFTDLLMIANDPFPLNVAHKLEGKTLRHGAAVSRRVEVRDRRTGVYIISTTTGVDGTFKFSRLPTQQLSNPYTVTSYDDSLDNPDNAMIIDRVYQIDNEGNPLVGAEKNFLNFDFSGWPSYSNDQDTTVIQGTVKDSLGVLCSREIRIYNRATGARLARTISDEVTGVFSLVIPVGVAEVYRIAVADDVAEGAVYNDITDRVLLE